MLLVLDKRVTGVAALSFGVMLRTLTAHAQEAAREPAPQPSATGDASPPAAAAPLQPSAAPETPAPSEPSAPSSWFARKPLRVELGQGAQRWSVTLFGFVEADYMFDSTRSYEDAMGSTLVARSDTYAGQTGRTQLSMRNTRLGLAFAAPSIGGVRASALIEADFFGNQPAPSEKAFFDSPGFRLRHAYLLAQTDYVDVLAGHTYGLIGFQNYFFPCTLEFLGIPNQLFSRSGQLRVSRSLSLGSEISLDVAAAAVRPAQRDAGVPDVQAGVRLSIHSWKGITTPGNTGTSAVPLSVGVSGTVRQFKVNAFAPPPTQRSNSATGWGLALDALVPIIPAADGDDRGNRLTLNGSFVTGTGIADLITTGGGATFPTLPNPAQANPAPLYTANVDPGLVSFDTQGVVHTIDWWAMRAGLQYYLPPTGRVIISVNYTQSYSGNMVKLFPRGGAEIELLTRVANRSHYADLNVMWDLTPVVRIGLSAQYTKVIYLDGDEPHNLRVMGQALYVF